MRGTDIPPLVVLFIGVTWGVFLDRARSFERLGHAVTIVDPDRFVTRSGKDVQFGQLGRTPQPWRFIHGRTGYRLVAKRIEQGVLREASKRHWDVVWVDGGYHASPSLIRQLHEHSGLVISYNIDDPTGGRDGRLWDQYLAALPEYDLVVVVRDFNVSEVAALGARNVLRVFRSFDNEMHRPRALHDEDRTKWGSDVAFVGTWMPERGPFLCELLEAGVPLTIYGDRWPKAPEWKALKLAWRGPVFGDEYAKAIQCAKITLGLLSKGNRDLHTLRSLEVPALGGLLCAERTVEHCSLYRDDVEAVFWDDATECVEKCTWLLRDEARRMRIAHAGHQRVMSSGLSNDEVISEILKEALRLRQ